MKTKYLSAILVFLSVFQAWSQTDQNNFINYQGVARDANNQLLTDVELVVRIGLHFGTANGTAAYEEQHAIMTDANGVFSLRIGSGTILSGDYGSLPWGSRAAFIATNINGVFVGTTEINAVPYAISSGDAQQIAAEVPYDNTVSGLPATNAQEALDALAMGGGMGTDDQNLVVTGDVLTIEGGMGSIDLATYIDDADADPGNELQTLSFDAGTNELSLSNGNTVTIPSGGTDADADPMNEIQDIALAGTQLSITRGSTIDLAPLIPSGGSDDQNLELTGDVLSIEGGTGSVDLSTYINDADFDPTNELQTLSFDLGTNELSLSNGNTVTLPSGGTGSSPWQLNGSSDVFYNSGNVGIGLTNPNAPHHVHQDAAESNSLYTTTDTGDGPSNGLFVGIVNRLDGFTGEIINQENGPLFLGTNGLNRLRIMANGQVGVGGIFPEEALDVEGTIRTRDLAGTGLRNVVADAEGNLVIGAGGGTDGDSDPMNEIQDITLDGTEISITSGSTIDLAPLIPPGGSDDQNLELTGDVLSIEGGTGSVDLSTYINDADFDPLNEVDVTTQTGILLGDGTDVTGLVGTADGQVPKWDATASAWVPGDDEVGTSGGGAEELNDLSDARFSERSGSLYVGQNSGNGFGDDNTAVGRFAMFSVRNGDDNSAFGSSALASNTTGDRNVAMGRFALFSNTTGDDNTAIGHQTLQNTTGSRGLTAVGSAALRENTTGIENTAVGYEALRQNSTGAVNTALGFNALRNNSIGGTNTAIGANALLKTTTGGDNTGVGSSALRENTTGGSNTAMGQSALFDNTVGSFNTAIGEFALFSNTTGGFNTALGRNALRNLTSGNNNTALGENAQVPNNTGSNQVRIGNTNIALAQIQVAWTVTSDRRWKKDIQDLPYGLNMVKQLRPVHYIRKNNDHPTRETGFIAQEVETVLQQLGYKDQGILTKDDNGYLSLRYNDFVPILTKAIQEQQTQIEYLKTQNESVLERLNELQQQMVYLLASNKAMNTRTAQYSKAKR